MLYLCWCAKAFSSCSAWVSHCSGFSCCRAWVPEHGISSCGRELAASLHVGSSWARNRAPVSCIGSWILDHWATRGALYHLFLLTVFSLPRTSPSTPPFFYDSMSKILLSLSSSRLNAIYYGMNVCVPLKFICWNSNTQYDGRRRQA